MFTSLAIAAIAILWIQHRSLVSRVSELDERLSGAIRDQGQVWDQIRSLWRRIQQRSPTAPSSDPGEEKRMASEPVAVAPDVQPEPIETPAPPIAAPIPPFVSEVEEPIASVAEPTAASTTAERDLRPPRRDWESLIGGNLLNKLGALLVVIGLALFLSYEATQLGPMGRSVIGLVVSLVLLALGWRLERKNDLRIFARGLLASGWASLYITAYAMYALEATRVIENPVVEVVWLLSVSTGMVLHSLRYRSQALTALAYGCAFAALALTNVTTFAALALAPLAATLLFVARRLGWYGLSLFGSAATYAVFGSRPVTGASLSSIETMLVIFWALFEAFDLLRIFDSRRMEQRAPRRWDELQFIVNALGGLGVSALIWQRMAPGTMWAYCAGAALAYLASTFFRVLLSEKDEKTSSLYGASLTIAAAMTGLAIFAHVDGIWRSINWLIEAEALYLAGVYLQLPFARVLAAFAFMWPIAGMWGLRGTSTVWGADIDNWAVPASIQALIFYGNRWLSRPSPY
jgi:hypothetical protein